MPSSPNVPNVPSPGPSPLGSWDRGSPLENSLLPGQPSSRTLCLVACHWSQAVAHVVQGEPPRSSPFAPHLDGRGLEKQLGGSRRGQRRVRRDGNSQPGSFPLLFSPSCPLPGSSGQPCQPFFSEAASFPAWPRKPLKDTELWGVHSLLSLLVLESC